MCAHYSVANGGRSIRHRPSRQATGTTVLPRQRSPDGSVTSTMSVAWVARQGLRLTALESSDADRVSDADDLVTVMLLKVDEVPPARRCLGGQHLERPIDAVRLKIRQVSAERGFRTIAAGVGRQTGRPATASPVRERRAPDASPQA